MPRPAASKRKNAVRKPVQHRSRATRAALLRAAAQLLGRRGSAEVTTNEIARRAGVSIGSLYEYFRDKDAIVQALVDEHLAAAEQLFAERARELAADAASRPLGELLAALVEAMLRFHADDPRVHRVLASEAARSRATRARVSALEDGAAQVLAALFATHPEAKIARPALAARVVVQTVDALTHRWILAPSGEPVALALLADELTRMLKGYVVDGGRARAAVSRS